jgi:glycosyltransferase involved in cell wall biosynthesis
MKKILHIIESITTGGAENLLCNTIAELLEYEHLIVTVFAGSDLSMVPQNAQHICLGAKSKASILFKLRTYKKVLKEYRPDFVHAHLYFATIIAKAGTPASMPLLFTQHFEFSKNATKWYYQFTDRILSTTKQTCLAVSNVVLEDYVATTGFKGRKKVIGIYIPDDYFMLNREVDNCNNGHLKMVALGNIKPIKNQQYLLDAFAFLKDLPVSCDVYGEGMGRAQLEIEARAKNINVFFKGSIADSSIVLPKYHLYIMPSLTEGFPLALFEAMAVGLVPIVSNIPVFHELLGNEANYIPLHHAAALRKIIEKYLLSPNKIEADGAQAKALAKAKASKKTYLKKIREVYAASVQMKIKNF